MGRNLQRRDDHSGRDRSPGPSLRNPGTEHPQLPHGTSQEESGRRLGVRGNQLTIMFISTTKMRRPMGCGKSRAVESEEVSLASHRPWKSRTTRGIPTFPTAPTAAGLFQTRSGILIVVDRKECLTPDILPSDRLNSSRREVVRVILLRKRNFIQSWLTH